MACLIVIDGALKGQKVAIDDSITRIGRRESNDWILQDESVSGTHCEIEKDDSGYILRDLGSTNGTKVNNEEIKEQRIFRNDILLIGEVPVTIEGDDVPDSGDSDDGPLNISRTTIVIQKNAPRSTPKEFTKKSNSNKIWVTVILLLLCVIGVMAFVLLKKMTGN